MRFEEALISRENFTKTSITPFIARPGVEFLAEIKNEYVEVVDEEHVDEAVKKTSDKWI